MNTAITVPFHGSELFVIEYNSQPYTPMKPIVDGMGLDWAAQFTKLKQKFASTIAEIAIVANDGKERLMICLPVRKLAAWMYSISPNKIPNLETRRKVVTYQNECDDVLWDYWTKGQAVNPRPRTKRTTKDKRTALHEAIALLMTKSKHLHFKDCYKIIHQRFNVNHLDEIPEDMLPEAVNFVYRLLVGDGAKPTLNEDIKANIQGLVSHMLWVNSFWRHIAAPLRGINSTLAGNVHDHFVDGASFANLVAVSMGLSRPEQELLAYFPWKGDAATIHQAKIRSVA